VADLLDERPHAPAYMRDHIVRREAGRLVDEEDAV
jgi:hypothetical protein